jgi:hypothetical protein
VREHGPTHAHGAEVVEVEFSFSSTALELLPSDVDSLTCTVATLESSGEAWVLSFACPELDGGVFDLQFQASPAFEVLPFGVGEPLTLELSSKAECLECHLLAIAIYNSEEQLQMLLFDSTDQSLSTPSGFSVEPDTPTLLVEQFNACEDDGQPLSERQYSLRFSRGDDELLLPPAQRSGELISGERLEIRVGESTLNPAPVGTAWRYFGVVVSR